MSVEDTLEAFKKQLKNHEKRISALEAQPKIKERIVTKPLSVKEFILSKKPRSDVQKTLSIGYYLEKYDSVDSFNIKDLEKGFRSAKETVPTNIPDKVYLNVKKGHMMEAKEKKDKIKAYVLTNSGERYVENNFQSED